MYFTELKFQINDGKNCPERFLTETECCSAVNLKNPLNSYHQKYFRSEKQILTKLISLFKTEFYYIKMARRPSIKKKVKPLTDDELGTEEIISKDGTHRVN